MHEETKVTAKRLLQLVESQKYRCALSGRTLTPETASLDHIVPLAQGGKHSLENLWVLDHQVNAAKGTLSVDELLAICREVVQHYGKADAPLPRVLPAAASSLADGK